MRCLLSTEGTGLMGGPHHLIVLFSARMTLNTHPIHVIPETVLVHLDPTLGYCYRSPRKLYHFCNHVLNQGIELGILGHVANSIFVFFFLEF